MCKLSLGTKLALLSGTAMLPGIVLMALLTSIWSERLEFLARERTGVANLATPVALALEALQAAPGTPLTPAHLPPLRAGRATPRLLPPATPPQRLRDLAWDFMALADDSNLTLDGSLDSSYVAALATIDLPTVATHLAHLREQPPGSDGMRAEVELLDELARTVDEHLSASEAANGTPVLTPEMRSAVADLVASLRAIKESLLVAASPPAEAIDRAQAVLVRAWPDLRAVLEARLDLRYVQQAQTIRLTLFAIAAATAAILLVSWLLARGIETTLWGFAKATVAIGRGRLDESVPHPGTPDGFGRLADGLEAMRARLQDAVGRLADETSRPKVERAQRLQALALEASGLGQFTLDGGAYHLDARCAALLGLQGPLSLPRERVAELIHPDDLPMVSGRVGDLLDGRSRHYLEEHRIVQPDGSVRWVCVRALVLDAFADGTARQIAGTVEDLTERKALEQRMAEAAATARAANDAKALFLSNISHELRTPLNGVLGMADVLALSDLTPEQREYLNVIKISGKLLLEVLNDIIEFARIDQNLVRPEWRPFRPRDLVGRLERVYRMKAAERGLEFRVACNIPYDEQRQGDEVRIQQILHHLISNALKFTPSGSVWVTVAGEPERLLITVTDSGIGIPPAKIPALFAGFTQGDPSPTRRHGGTGLGLAITKGLVDAMGGSIAVETALGAGSRFEVSLPAPGVPTPAPAAERLMAATAS